MKTSREPPTASRPDTPPPVHVRQSGDVTLYINPGYRGTMDEGALLQLPERIRHAPGRASRRRGRITTWRWQPSWHDGPGLRVREYVHGGVLGRLFGGFFLGSRRMRNELSLHISAHQAGVPTSEPVALRIERVRGPLVRAHYVSEEIPGALDLLALCREHNRPFPARRRALAHAVAECIARMHDAGILHADLNLRNLLISKNADRPRCSVIDFDKGVFRGELTLGQRMANLLRLERSVLKWAAARHAISALDRLRMLRSYLCRYPVWCDRWGAIARQYASRHLRHRFSRERDQLLNPQNEAPPWRG